MGIDNMFRRPSTHGHAWMSFDRARRHAMVHIMAYNYHLRRLVEPEDMELTKSTESHRTDMAATRVFRGRPSCFQDVINSAKTQPVQSEGKYWPLALNRSGLVAELNEMRYAMAGLRHSKALGLMNPLIAALCSGMVLWAYYTDPDATQNSRIATCIISWLVFALSLPACISRLAARMALSAYESNVSRCFQAAADWTLSAEHAEELSRAGYSFLWMIQGYWLMQEFCIVVLVKLLLPIA